LDAVPVLLCGERLAEAAVVAIVGDSRIDAEDERSLAGKRACQVNFDRGPAVSVNGDRDPIHEDRRFVEDALHDEVNALIRPVRRDLDAAPIATHPVRLAQRRKLSLPDPGRADRMALAVEPRRRPFDSKSQSPSSVSIGRRPTASISIS
jgi:hypothetical protein